MDGKTTTMMQIINISANILYDQQKADNKFLQLINACISHELRNPLNSIIAQNMEKTMLYDELEKILEENGYQGCDKTTKTKIRNLLKRLKQGKTVQESSANLMSFLVQDFLDYAQIKAGKFRINNVKFNIKEAIEKVMSIQRKKATDMGIDFKVRYLNIADNPDEAVDGLNSPFINSD